MEFASTGFAKVTGIDLRKENIAQANFLSRAFEVPNVRFIEDNVRNLAKYGKHDVVFCGGLLYHVTFPYEFIMDLFNAANEFVILDSRANRDAFSGFNLVMNKNVASSLEGEFSA